MHKQRLGVLAGAGIGILGVFLPWISSPFLSVSGISAGGWAYVVLLAYLGALFFGFMGDKMSPLATMGRIGALLTGLGGTGSAVYVLIKLGEIFRGGGAAAGMVSTGFGLYMCIIGGIVVVGAIFSLEKK